MHEHTNKPARKHVHAYAHMHTHVYKHTHTYARLRTYKNIATYVRTLGMIMLILILSAYFLSAAKYINLKGLCLQNGRIIFKEIFS